MRTYTCKKTGQKFTEQEMLKRRQERSKRQMRAKLFMAIFLVSFIAMGTKLLS